MGWKDAPEVVNDPASNPDAPEWSRAPVIEEKPPFSFGRNVAEPFNRGVAGLLDLPVNLANLGSAAISSADKWLAEDVIGKEPIDRSPPQLTAPFTEAAERLGVVAPPEEQRHGLIPRAMEFTGGSVIPLGAAMHLGGKSLSSLSPVPSALQTMGRSVASSPGKATAFDVASNFTAATGGEVAKQFTDNETVIAVAEFGGGFAVTAALLIPDIASKTTLAGRSKDAIVETLAPFTEAGGKVSAARRLQEIAGDPESAAARIDPDSGLPPALQTADPGLIKLQNMILSRNPRLKKIYTEELNRVIKQLKTETNFGGDTDRARHLLNVRAQMAIEEAADVVSRMKPNASPRQISVAARNAIDSALDDALKIESALWNKVDDAVPAGVANAKQALNDELSIRSFDADPEDIPKWLVSRLNAGPIDEKLLAQLAKQGLVDSNGVIDPVILKALERQGVLKTRQRTFNDVKTLRSRVLREVRAEKAKDAPNRNKIRILNDIQSGLLDDMTETGAKGAAEARQFSALVNEKFRQGRVGRLLGYDRTGAEKVAAEDLLSEVIYGRAGATNTQRVVEMANEAPELTLNYIKARYIESVYGDNTPDLNAHRAFTRNLRKSGMFEVFPELEAQLNRVQKLNLKAIELDVPDSQINTTRINKNQSRAALLLQADPGQEMALILKSKNPSKAAQEILKVVARDRSAVQGLKTSFAEEVFRLSGGNTLDVDGRIIPNGTKLKALLKEYRTTMRALHMSDADINKLERVAEQYRVAQMTADDVDIGSTITNKGLLPPVDLIARFVGARTGGKMGSDMGSSLVLANFMSKQGRERIMNLTTSKAEKLLIRATLEDPELYRALLVGPTRTNAEQVKAAAVLERAIMQLEVSGARTLAIASANANEDNE